MSIKVKYWLSINYLKRNSEAKWATSSEFVGSGYYIFFNYFTFLIFVFLRFFFAWLNNLSARAYIGPPLPLHYRDMYDEQRPNHHTMYFNRIQTMRQMHAMHIQSNNILKNGHNSQHHIIALVGFADKMRYACSACNFFLNHNYYFN